MDRTINQSTIRKRQAGRVLKWVLIAAGLGLTVYYGLRLLRPSGDADSLRFATVERGPVSNTITATALILPAFEEQVNAPVATTIKSVVLEAGKEVNAGDLLLKLDRDYVGLQLDGRRDALAVKENSIDLLRLEYDRDLRDLGYDAEIKKLELASAKSALGDAQRLQKVGGATEEEVETAEFAVRILELEVKKLDNQLAYSQSSLAGRKRQLQLEVGMEEKEVRQLSRKLAETEVRAPRAGVVTWVNENIGQRVEEGAPLVRIANLGRYKIEGTASDRYAEQLTVGMPIELKLPRVTLSGTITDILPEVSDNTLKFRVDLDDPSDENLRPNMRAELNVVQDRRENALRVKNGPAFRGGNRQEVFVVRGGEAVRTDVNLGLRNGEFVEILSGVGEGDRLIISATDAYDRLNTLQLDVK